MHPLPDKTILLFDGMCGVCSRFVNAALKSDVSDRFRFAAQQSESGQKILSDLGIPYDGKINSMVLIDGGSVYRYSSALFQICRRLGGFWRLWLIFSFLPVKWTDAAYLAFSERRFVFGTRSVCRMPTESEKSKFL